MLKIFILFLIYAVIFMVPTSLAGKRRRSGLPVHWWLLLISLALELVVVYIGLGLLEYSTTSNVEHLQRREGNILPRPEGRGQAVIIRR